jgi:regulator of sigma E protease
MITAILVLSFLIFFHELGHFLMAKLVGVKVEVFSIGFGKKLFCKKIKDTDWCISAIPLGGYVQMKGQDDTNPYLKNFDPDSYNTKTPWQRILILLGGPGFNFLLAFLIYLFVGMYGVTKFAPIVGETIKNTPAYELLKKGDNILEINNHKVKVWDDIPKLVKKYNTLHLKVQRGNKIIFITLKPKIEFTKNIFNEEVKRKIIGITPYKLITVRYSFAQALKYATDELIKASTLIIKGVEKLITGAIGIDNLSGPIGIVDMTNKVSHYGIVPLLMFMALLSVNLGVLNLLPIPALDGGHIIFNLYEAFFKKELSEEIMVKLTIGGWVILGSLMLIGIYNDIHRLVGG